MTNPETISLVELAHVSGGRGPAWSPHSIGMKVMSALDKPGKSLDTVRDTLGMGRAGSPGDVYRPATSSPDGSINNGRFETPSSGPQVPMSR